MLKSIKSSKFFGSSKFKVPLGDKNKKEQLKEPIKEQLLLEKRVEENNLTELKY